MRNPIYKIIAFIVIIGLLGLFSPSVEAYITTTLTDINSTHGKITDETSGQGSNPSSEPFPESGPDEGSQPTPEPILQSSLEPSPELSPEPTPESSPETTPKPTPEPDLSATAVMTAVGDIILHQTVISGGLQTDKSSYSYDYLFKAVSPLFKLSDYTIANYEGTLNGPPYTGYPMFGAPDAIATALKTAGVDMVTTANNHAFDWKLPGLIRTPKVFLQAGIDVVGTRFDAKEPPFKLVDVNGIKIGITAYTWETIGTEKRRALNGMNLPLEANALVDSFNSYRPARFKQDMNAMKIRIQAMKDAKAECIVFLLHWGNEYKTVSNPTQRKLAQFLSDQGVDVIIGHHPHVLQEISVLTSSNNGKNTLVYYSLGNFLANMKYSTKGTNGNAEDAMIAKVEIQRDKAGNISVTKGGYLATYIRKKNIGGKILHTVIPVRMAIQTPKQFGMEKQVILLKNSMLRIEKVIGKSNGLNNGILIQEWLGE